ncbi:hypothetical protein TRFO_22658 [Tritrichomonas foetus]|uniref:USP domain-containing protein n=1 Tax=Tritrichomonas foetus TaxID=1144522 RepID=A0A1J4KCP8_9EUKA|nr:hypothetical protein TRFO_22658 [Tritrichomonas foetus]|eukprot:OHT08746.1 hypothetical protein TRFO_22658 [Tritrichomonas foetus]
MFLDEDFCSWNMILQTAIKENNDISSFYPLVTSTLYEIIENNHISDPYSSYTNSFVHETLPNFVEIVLNSNNSNTNVDNDQKIDFLKALVLLGIYSVSNDDFILLNLIKKVIEPTKSIYHENNNYSEILDFFIESGVAYSIYDIINFYNDFLHFQYLLDLSSILIRNNKNQEISNLIFNGILKPSRNFFDQFNSKESIRRIDSQILDTFLTSYRYILYYFKPGIFPELEIFPILDFSYFCLTCESLEKKLIGCKFFEYTFTYENLFEMILKWPKIDKLKEFFTTFHNLHIEIIKKTTNIFDFYIKNQKMEINELNNFYNHTIYCHSSDREQYFQLISILLTKFPINKSLEFVFSKCENENNIYFEFLRICISNIEFLNDDLAEKIFEHLFELREKNNEANEIIWLLIDNFMNINFRFYMIEFFLQYLNEEFIINALIKLIKTLPLGKPELYDESILSVLILQINQNRKGIFSVISEYLTKFQKKIEFENLMEIFEIDDNIFMDDCFWLFISTQLMNLGSNALSDKCAEYIFELFNKINTVSENFAECLRYCLLLANYKNHILLSDNNNQQLEQILQSDFYFIKVPVIGTDILWHFYFLSKDEKTSKIIEECILLFYTRIKGVPIEEICKNFLQYYNPILHIPIDSKSIKLKYFHILNLFIHSIEKDDDNYEYGLYRHSQNINRERYRVIGSGFDSYMLFQGPLHDQNINEMINKYLIYSPFSFEVYENTKTIQIISQYNVPLSIHKFPSLILANGPFYQELLNLMNSDNDFEIPCWNILQFLPSSFFCRDRLQKFDFSIFSKANSIYVKRYYLQIICHLLEENNPCFMENLNLNDIISLLLKNYSSYEENKEFQQDVLSIFMRLPLTNENFHMFDNLYPMIFEDLNENTEIKIMFVEKVKYFESFHEFLSHHVEVVMTLIKNSNSLSTVNQIVLKIENQVNLIKLIIQNLDSFCKSTIFLPIFGNLIDKNKNVFDFGNLAQNCQELILNQIENQNINYNSILLNSVDYFIVDLKTQLHKNILNEDKVIFYCSILNLIINNTDFLIQKKIYYKKILTYAFQIPNDKLHESFLSLFLSIFINLSRLETISCAYHEAVENFTNSFLLNCCTSINNDLNPQYYEFAKQFIGLKNSGSVCYANSILQQLFHIREFAETLLKSDFENELQLIFANLILSNRHSIEPLNYYQSFPTFQCNVQQDAVEFLTLLLERIPLEITHIFKGEIENCISSTNKEIPFEETNIENFFVYPLSIKNPIDFNNFIKIFEQNETIFDYFNEKLKISCTVCKHSKLKSLPKVLILQLKRFEYDMRTYTRFKINKNVEFPLDLTLANHHYSLCGIVSHIGNPELGHYISYIKNTDNTEINNNTEDANKEMNTSTINCKWIYFNDTYVTKLTELPNDINSTAYILFYIQDDAKLQQNSQHLNIKSRIVKEIEKENLEYSQTKHIFSESTFCFLTKHSSFEVLTNYFFNVFVYTKYPNDYISIRMAELTENETYKQYFLNFIELHISYIISLFELNTQQFLPPFLCICTMIDDVRLFDFCNIILDGPINFNKSLFLDKVISQNDCFLVLAENSGWIEKLKELLMVDHNFDVQFLLHLLYTIDNISSMKLIYSFENILNNNSIFPENKIKYISFLISIFPRVSIELKKFVSYFPPTKKNELIIELLINSDEITRNSVLKFVFQITSLDFVLETLKNYDSKGNKLKEILKNHFVFVLYFVAHNFSRLRTQAREILEILSENENVGSLLFHSFNYLISLIKNDYHSNNNRLDQILIFLKNKSSVYSKDKFTCEFIINLWKFCNSLQKQDDSNILLLLNILQYFEKELVDQNLNEIIELVFIRIDFSLDNYIIQLSDCLCAFQMDDEKKKKVLDLIFTRAFSFSLFPNLLSKIFNEASDDMILEQFLQTIESIADFGQIQLPKSEWANIRNLAFIITNSKNNKETLVSLLPFSESEANQYIGNFPNEIHEIFSDKYV